MMLTSHHYIPNHPAQESSTICQKMSHAFQFPQEFQEDQGPMQNTKVLSILYINNDKFPFILNIAWMMILVIAFDFFSPGGG